MTRILIAAESPPVRRSFETQLRNAGYEVLTVAGGREAVERALKGDLALVLLDAKLTGLNGTIACRLLKSQPATRTLPVLMLGGPTGAAGRSWRRETGADQYIPEDAPMEDTLEIVEELLYKVSPTAQTVDSPEPDPDILAGMGALLDRKLFEATLFFELGQAVASHERPDKVFASAMGVVARAVDFSAGALAFVEGGQIEVLLMIRRPLPPATLDDLEARIVASAKAERGPTPAGPVTTRRFVGGTEDEVPPSTEGGLGKLEVLSGALGGGAKGLVTLAGPSVSEAVDEHRAFLDQLATQALLVTQNARLSDRAHRLSQTDDLTGLHNHRHTVDLIRAELERAERYGAPLSLLLIDIDGFKAVNDEQGHAAGDETLREVGRLLCEALRAVDHVGRYGGEEFVAILPHTGREAANGTADRLRSMVETHELGKAPAGFRVTVSIGVATAGSETTSSSAVLKEAHQALSRAKEAGKNCVQ